MMKYYKGSEALMRKTCPTGDLKDELRDDQQFGSYAQE